MELIVLGSGTIAPSDTRTASAHWILTSDVFLQLDCGPGTLHRAAGQEQAWHRVTHVAVTHFHVDHWGELPALLFALRWGVEPPRSDLLTLIGPPGFHDRLTLLAAALGDWVLAPGYPLEVKELASGSGIKLSERVSIEAFETPHTEQSVAYAVREEGTRLVYTGDTGPSDALAAWAAECDLLLAECSLPDDRGIEIHLTPTSAGALGRAARAKRLVLTHFYPVFGETDPAATAARVFGGPVTAAQDGDRFRVGN